MIKPHGGKLINRVFREKEEEARELHRIAIRRDQAKDAENIANGVFSPLEGFLNQEDYKSVLYEKRLANDIPWTIPIVLDVSEEDSKKISEGEDLALTYKDKIVAILHLEEKYDYDKKEFAEKIFGTDDKNHPGVNKVYEMKEVLLAGNIDLISETDNPFLKYTLKPIETRILFKEKGWKTIAGFQTRNVPHLGHEYVQKTALTFVDGIFINPVIGKKKKGDFRDDVILETYEALINNYYLKDSAVLSILQFEMRYAGPREAIFHSIVRKNFGCTHFIVGRDHAGVGDYYDPYEAQEIFNEFPDLGIVPIFFKSFFYCKRCSGIANEKTCPHDENQRIKFSGTRIREAISKKKIPPKELMRKEVAEIILRKKNPFVV
ncbi:MAG: sulfate adenylyltransferase [Candidatus Hydrothermarchaeota archaeon]